jgi:hypothetical protein
MSCALVLLMTIDVMVVVGGGGCSALLLYQGGRGYKESHRVSYNCSCSITLSLAFSNYKI